ncbi:flagellar biosynthesis protein FlhF [Gracilibacillus alcaliphilus]|uniref:flagellar biosynthesis protein FlhF n=1 Tax=Gracilibacillus alcaliphilus TaxID=1401441 RepID=UPI0019565FFD|nr:flagellar biosynthesis protein FlhF [Gracilibacillus alcaliphilus]MBM7677952.1 flagellar biosynthesis protein FlhF [Gracilibacillus alcaliphilus]
MKVKKIKGETMPEVMQVVKKELGPDAVILNSKIVYEGGFLGLFKKRKIEVLAAVDHAATPKKNPVKQKVKNRQKLEKAATISAQDSLLKELREMKSMLKEQKNDDLFAAPYQEAYQHLLAAEVDSSIAHEIIQAIQHRFESKEIDMDQLSNQLAFEIKNRLAQKGNFGGDAFDKQIIHLVGPTGVGKTTTIAKLAAECVLNRKKKVAFITTDTYRIAAIEQLKTYSKILDVPIEIAYNMKDYQKARDQFKDYDYIFVDTAGRNFRDDKYVDELGKIVDLTYEVNTYLVLSLTTRASDVEVIYQQFNKIPIKQAILTKEDETNTYGTVLNLCLKHDVGLAYITNGQDVPDDIQEASIDQVANLIVGGLRK